MKAAAELIKAWATLEERKRILLGKALPGEELRATAVGLVQRSITSRKIRALPQFKFAAPPPACVSDTPSPGVLDLQPVEPTPQLTQAPPDKQVAAQGD
jgi:hypothetical protein